MRIFLNELTKKVELHGVDKSNKVESNIEWIAWSRWGRWCH